MPNNPTIRGDNSVLWGAGGVYDGTGVGYVTTGRHRAYSEKVEIQDENGYTVAVVYFDEKNDVEFEMVIKTSAPAIAVGDGVTICGIAYALVDEVEKMWEQRGVQKFRVKATNYVAIEDPS